MTAACNGGTRLIARPAALGIDQLRPLPPVNPVHAVNRIPQRSQTSAAYGAVMQGKYSCSCKHAVAYGNPALTVI